MGKAEQKHAPDKISFLFSKRFIPVACILNQAGEEVVVKRCLAIKLFSKKLHSSQEASVSESLFEKCWRLFT